MIFLAMIVLGVMIGFLGAGCPVIFPYARPC